MTEKIQDYKNGLIEKAEHLINIGFQEKIVQLNDLLETSMFVNRNLTEAHQNLNIPVPKPNNCGNNADNLRAGSSSDGYEPLAKKIKLDNDNETPHFIPDTPNGRVPCNQPLCEMIELIKPIIRTLIEDTNLLKMWISFMVPKIEDCNNFGVQIQEDILDQIEAVKPRATKIFDQISVYFLERAKVVSKVTKYPFIDDYRRAVDELDEQECLTLWLIVCAIRNRYSLLHDVIIKNIEKLTKPRTSNAESYN